MSLEKYHQPLPNSPNSEWSDSPGPTSQDLCLYSFGKLTALTYIDLSFNQLTGSIPPSLSLLPNLAALHLDRERLTGTIPESFGAFTGLSSPHLFLSHNQLTGSVPKSLDNLHFSTIDFSWNRLAGDISFLFGNAKTLLDADFSGNLFEFDISKLEFPETLNALDLNQNILKGSVPVGLTTLENLQHFTSVTTDYVCRSRLEANYRASLTPSTYFHNRCLCGAPLPAC